MKLKNIINEEIKNLNQSLYEAVTQTIYMFDMEGNLIDTLNNAAEVSNKFGISKTIIFRAISRKSIVGHKYYFSYNKNFIPPIKKINFNPLYGGSQINRTYNHEIDGNDSDV